MPRRATLPRTSSLDEDPANAATRTPIDPSRPFPWRYLFWLTLVPAAFAAYFWLPWPGTWIETGLLLGLIACLFVAYEVSRL